MNRRNTSYKKKRKMYAVAVLVVLMIVTISGCAEKPEEVQDKANIYIYEEMGGEGDPQEQIREFYDIALQEAGGPVIKPLAQYAAEYELDPETGQVIPDTIKIYDPDGNPVDRETAIAMQDDIATDDAGNIITDAAQLDIHIEEIGENKYQIHNLRQELVVEDGVWRVKGYPENDYYDKNLVDNIIKVSDNKDEFAPGLVLGSDGNIYGVIIADKDVFDIYGGEFGIMALGENHPDGIDKEECIDLGGGLYAYLYNLSETPKGSASVHSPHPISQDTRDKFAVFRFIKENT